MKIKTFWSLIVSFLSYVKIRYYVAIVVATSNFSAPKFRPGLIRQPKLCQCAIRLWTSIRWQSKSLLRIKLGCCSDPFIRHTLPGSEAATLHQREQLVGDDLDDQLRELLRRKREQDWRRSDPRYDEKGRGRLYPPLLVVLVCRSLSNLGWRLARAY